VFFELLEPLAYPEPRGPHPCREEPALIKCARYVVLLKTRRLLMLGPNKSGALREAILLLGSREVHLLLLCDDSALLLTQDSRHCNLYFIY
jgi:hypothetical protein